jgi:CRISPR/Cas system-associated endonuclease Cas1
MQFTIEIKRRKESPSKDVNERCIGHGNTVLSASCLEAKFAADNECLQILAFYE